MKHLWAYIKEKNLQNEDKKAFFTPDKKMAKVFGKDSIRGFSMSKYLGAHLSAIDDWEVCLKRQKLILKPRNRIWRKNCRNSGHEKLFLIYFQISDDL